MKKRQIILRNDEILALRNIIELVSKDHDAVGVYQNIKVLQNLLTRSEVKELDPEIESQKIMMEQVEKVK